MLKLKEKIAEEKGTDYAVENQKLIYAGTFKHFRTLYLHVSHLQSQYFTCVLRYQMKWWSGQIEVLFQKNRMMCICCVVGKILEDSKAVNDYKIEEKNFVVVMVTKVRDWTDPDFYKVVMIDVFNGKQKAPVCTSLSKS